MDEEMIINMITNCARMEAALQLLRRKANFSFKTGEKSISLKDINEVLFVGGMELLEMAEDPSAATE